MCQPLHFRGKARLFLERNRRHSFISVLAGFDEWNRLSPKIRS